MSQLFRSKRRLLAAVAVMSVAAVLGAGYAYSAISDTGNVYTGCLANGSIQYVAIGTSPQKKCTNPAVQVSWSETGPKGDQGIQGLPGTNGAPGVSPTVTALPAGDSNCPAGGAKITDANNSTAYVCSGQDGRPGTDGAPFSGTFTSGAYSISVTSTGILLAGPGPTTIGLNGTGLTMRSSNPIDIRGDGIVGIQAGTNLNLKASEDALVQAGVNLNLKGAAAVDAQSSGAFGITAANLLDLKGALVHLNGSGGCLPAARVTDPITGTAAADGSVTGEITAGSSTICVGG